MYNVISRWHSVLFPFVDLWYLKTKVVLLLLSDSQAFSKRFALKASSATRAHWKAWLKRMRGRPSDGWPVQVMDHLNWKSLVPTARSAKRHPMNMLIRFYKYVGVVSNKTFDSWTFVCCYVCLFPFLGNPCQWTCLLLPSGGRHIHPEGAVGPEGGRGGSDEGVMWRWDVHRRVSFHLAGLIYLLSKIWVRIFGVVRILFAFSLPFLQKDCIYLKLLMLRTLSCQPFWRPSEQAAAPVAKQPAFFMSFLNEGFTCLQAMFYLGTDKNIHLEVDLNDHLTDLTDARGWLDYKSPRLTFGQLGFKLWLDWSDWWVCSCCQ